MTGSAKQVSMISAGLDPSNFVEGAAKINAAARSMGAALSETDGTINRTQRTLTQTSGQYDKLVRSITEGARAAAGFARDYKTIEAGVASGRGLTEASNALDALARKWLGTGKAAEDAAAKMRAALANGTKIDVSAITQQALAEKKAQEAAESHAKSIDALRAKYLPLETEVKNYQKTLTELQALERAGVGTAEERSAALAKAANDHKHAMDTIKASAERATGSTKLQGYQITNLSYQLQDFATQVGSGQGIFRPLIQQAPQAIDAMGGVSGALGAVGRNIGMLATGGLIVGAVAAFGYLGYQAESQARKINALKNALIVGGNQGTISADDAYAASKRLATSTTASSSDALTATQSFVTNPKFKELAAELGGPKKALDDLNNIAVKVSHTLNTDLADAAATVANFMEDPVAAVRKYYDLLGRDYELRGNVERLTAQGKAAEAAAIALRALGEATKHAEDNTTPLQKQWTALVNSLTAGEDAAKKAGNGIGTILVDALTSALGWLTTFSEHFRKVVGMLNEEADRARETGEVKSAGRIALERLGIVSATGSSAPSPVVQGGVKAEDFIGQNRAQLDGTFKAAGVNTDLTAAWCADFTNAILQKNGFKGTNSSAAASFNAFGTAVGANDKVQRNDVLVDKGGHHVGVATGEERYSEDGNLGGRRKEVFMVAGNEVNRGPTNSKVNGRWVDADSVNIRRPTETIQATNVTIQAPNNATVLDDKREGARLEKRTLNPATDLAIAEARDSGNLSANLQNIDNALKRFRDAKADLANMPDSPLKARDMAVLDDAITKLGGDLYAAVTPHQAFIRSLNQQNAAMQSLDPAQKAIDANMVQWEEAMKRAGRSTTDQAERNEVIVATLANLNLQYRATVNQVDLQVASQQRVTLAWGKGAEAAEHQANVEKAMEVVRQSGIRGTQAQAAAAEELANKMDKLTNETTKQQYAQQHLESVRNKDTLKLQGSLVGADYATQNRTLAENAARQNNARNKVSDTSPEGAQAITDAREMADLQTQTDKTTDAFRELNQTSERALDTMGTGLIDALDTGRIKSFGDAFKQVWKDIANELLKLAVMNPLKNWITGSNSGSMGSLFGAGGGLLSMFGGGNSGTQVYDSPVGPNLDGSAMGTGAGNAVGLLSKVGSWVTGLFSHEGGIAGEQSTFQRSMPASTWVGAPRYHTGGIAGLAPDEVPAILQRGERVLTQRQQTQMASNAANNNGSSAPSVVMHPTINIVANDPNQFRASSNQLRVQTQRLLQQATRGI